MGKYPPTRFWDIKENLERRREKVKGVFSHKKKTPITRGLSWFY